MRDIKFRGYNKTYGWVVGFVTHVKENTPAKIQNDEFQGGIMVDTDTVCEFTGFTDNNNVDIFEGDILKSSTGKKFEVIFNNGAFWCRDIIDPKRISLLCNFIDTYDVEIVEDIYVGVR